MLRRAVADGATPIDDEAIDFLAARSEGDARTALNALELALATAAELGEGSVTIARAEDALQRRAVLYDKGGDRHYDYISAWIKATRGSDPDASLYYLAVMLEGGEDPRFIVRRMVILASEDIGNADPRRWRGGRRGPGGRARGPAGGQIRARAGGDLPGAGAEVERRRARAGGGAAARARAWRGAGAGVAAVGPAAGTGETPAVTTTPTAIPGTSPRRSCCPRGSSGSASTSPTRPRRSSRGAWSRFAGCAGDRGAVELAASITRTRVIILK